MTKQEARKVNRGDKLIYHPNDSEEPESLEVKVTNIYDYEGEICKFDTVVLHFKGTGIFEVCAPVACFDFE